VNNIDVDAGQIRAASNAPHSGRHRVALLTAATQSLPQDLHLPGRVKPGP
jgi:hypothetical protein